MDQRHADFFKNLEPFPHFFKLENLDKVSPSKWRSIRDKLRAETANYHSQPLMYRSRDSNVIAFASFQLKDFQEALDEVNKTLEENSDNIVANSNKAVFLWTSGELPGAKKQLDILEEMSKAREERYNEKLLEGRAEMAYCYSRMGPSFIANARVLFEAVVQSKPTEVEWKVGLAICLARSGFPNQRMIQSDSKRPKENEHIQSVVRAAKLFMEVKDDSHALPFQKGFACVNLGSMLSRSNMIYDHIHSICKGISTEQFLNEAETQAPTYPYVLTEIGKTWQRKKNFVKATQYFETSNTIIETDGAHASLGYILRGRSFKENGNARLITKEKALQHFQKAVELSYGEHTKHLYNVGILQKELGRDQEALDTFKQILCDNMYERGPIHFGFACQESGLITLELFRKSYPPNEELRKGSISFLQEAVHMWTRLSALSPNFNDRQNRRNICFESLIKAIEDDPTLSDIARRKMVAWTLHMKGDHQEALRILRQTQDASTPDSHDLQIHCLIKQKEYENAVQFLDFLSNAGHLDRLRERYRTLPALVYCLAARAQLAGTANHTDYGIRLAMARLYFQSMLDEMCPPSQHCGGQASEAEDESFEDWHMVILHDPQDDSIATTADRIKELLKYIGLNATCMSDDVHPGRSELDGTLQNAESCRVQVFVIGNTTESAEFKQGSWDLSSRHDLSQKGTVSPVSRRIVVKTAEDAWIPLLLRGLPSINFPTAISHPWQTPSAAVGCIPHNVAASDASHGERASSGMLHYDGAMARPSLEQRARSQVGSRSEVSLSLPEINAVCQFLCDILQVPDLHQYLS